MTHRDVAHRQAEQRRADLRDATRASGSVSERHPYRKGGATRIFAKSALYIRHSADGIGRQLGDEDRAIVQEVEHIDLIGRVHTRGGESQQTFRPILRHEIEQGSRVAVEHAISRQVDAGQVLALEAPATSHHEPFERAGRETIARPHVRLVLPVAEAVLFLQPRFGKLEI